MKRSNVVIISLALISILCFVLSIVIFVVRAVWRYRRSRQQSISDGAPFRHEHSF